jgi:DNA-directed RNA polymerase subunit RPC12/RpoP
MKEYPMPVATSGDDDMDSYICPSCKNELAPVDDDFIFYMSPEELENSALCYCGHCGQKLDWSKHIKNSEK